MNVSILIKKLNTDELIKLKKIVEKELTSQLRKSDLSINIMDLDISLRSLHCLRFNDIKTLNELTCIKPSELKNTGQKTIQELTETLTVRGLNWGL
jgi:DNA-directed RNA polymerase alpha subunit